MEARGQCTSSCDWMYDVDVDYKQEENRDCCDRNLSRLLNKGNQIKVLHKKDKLCPGRDLHIPRTADEKLFWEKLDGWQLYMTLWLHG